MHMGNSANVSIIATRPIGIGEEITSDYTAGHGGLNVSKIEDRQERIDLLKKHLEFTCSCVLCKEIDDSWIDYELD